MTKKSSARLARDAEARIVNDAEKARTSKRLANNTCWDDLKSIHEDCVNLLNAHTHLAAYANDKNLIDRVSDKDTLAGNIRQLANDLSKMNEELKEIQNQHADKVGGSDNPDVVMTTITIFEQYNLFMERHQAVVMPTAMHIIEQFEAAEHILLRNIEEEKNRAESEALIAANTGISDAVIIREETIEQPPVH